MDEKRLLAGAALSLSLILSGCSGGLSGLGARLMPAGEGPSSSQDGWLTSRVSLKPSCIVDNYGKSGGGFLDGLSVLGPIVLPALIDAGLSLISGGIRNVASMTRTNVAARTNGHFLRGDPTSAQFRTHEDLGCVVFAYGRMNPSGGVTDNLGDVWETEAAEFAARGFNFAQAPLFYFEGIVRFSGDSNTFSISTAYLRVDDSLHRGGLFTQRSDDIVMTFTFQRREGEVVAVGALPFHDLAQTTTLAGDAAAAYATSWMAFPEPTERDQMRLAVFCEQQGCPVPAATPPVVSAACSAASSLCAQPFTLAVQLSVTSNASAAIEEIANQLDYARPAIAPELQTRLSESLNLTPTTPAQASLRQTANQACVALRQSRATYEAAQPEARAAMAADVRTKIDAAETAYEAAGLTWWNVVADSAVGCALTR